MKKKKTPQLRLFSIKPVQIAALQFIKKKPLNFTLFICVGKQIMTFKSNSLSNYQRKYNLPSHFWKGPLQKTLEFPNP